MAVQDSAPRSKGEWLADKDLVGRVNAGDGLAFRQVMERYNQCLYRVARAIMSDDAEAEDVVQQSYVRAFAAMKDFRGDSGLRTWLTRIVINEGRGRLRRQRTRHDNGKFRNIASRKPRHCSLSRPRRSRRASTEPGDCYANRSMRPWSMLSVAVFLSLASAVSASPRR